eukprot:TRINITY_DN3225_c0_g1_i1.p1 TRINITY_DN3225_c0_g1~~TRINITY_DN3225_c0_g1_i1.p1  ORF type:complete len:381 (-),score=28.85 TRINITY_DN3225_c0_g1_i1:441-1583(-)
MQGDVYGWRQTEALTRLDQEDSQWTIPGVTEDKYAWDPWTKRAYVLGRRIPFKPWCWELQDFGWWGAIMFFVGSILFVLGSTSAIFKAVSKNEQQERWLFVLPYFVGAILYAVGCQLLVILSAMRHPQRISVVESRPESPLLGYIEEGQQYLEQEQSTPKNSQEDEEVPDCGVETNVTSFSSRWKAYQQDGPVRLPMTEDELSDIVAASYMKDELHHIRADPWYVKRYRIDLSGAIIVYVGSLLYVISCGTEFYKDLTGHYPNIHGDPTYWLIKLPNIIGGVLFVVGSGLYVLSVHRSYNIMIIPLCSVPWWILLINLAGSFGFLFGAAVDIPLFQFAADTLIQNWLEIFIGYVIGSALFLVGSYLMIIEIGTVKLTNNS